MAIKDSRGRKIPPSKMAKNIVVTSFKRLLDEKVYQCTALSEEYGVYNASNGELKKIHSLLNKLANRMLKRAKLPYDESALATRKVDGKNKGNNFFTKNRTPSKKKVLEIAIKELTELDGEDNPVVVKLQEIFKIDEEKKKNKEERDKEKEVVLDVK